MSLSLKTINAKIAVVLTEKVGTMWCAYAFMGLALISLPEAIHGGRATLIAWVAQTFLQLVLLPVIMVGQAVQSEKSETRAEEDHTAIMQELQEIKEMHSELTLLHSEKAGCGYKSPL